MPRCIPAMWLLLSVTAACTSEGSFHGDHPGNGSHGRTAAAAGLAEPDLTQMMPPSHGEATSWSFPAGEHVAGTGPCVGVTLSSVLEQIRSGFAQVRGIRRFRSLGPSGVTMNAGAPVPLTEPSPVPMDRSAFVLGLMDVRSFGAVFFQGERCRGDRCEDRQYWYFETDEQCRPLWVGYHRATDKAGGRYGICVDAIGGPLWHFPGNPTPRQRCDADWSAQDISGTRRAFSIDPHGSCSTIQASIVPIELTVTQGADRAFGAVTLTGSGIPFIDGRTFHGSVERQAFSNSTNETTTGACPVRRDIKIRLDFEEGPSLNAVPGGFGLVDILEQSLGACAQGAGPCAASLHLIKGT